MVMPGEMRALLRALEGIDRSLRIIAERMPASPFVQDDQTFEGQDGIRCRSCREPLGNRHARTCRYLDRR